MKQLLAFALRLFRCVSEADGVAGLVLGLTLKTAAAAVAAPEGPPLSLISSATPKLLLPCPPSHFCSSSSYPPLPPWPFLECRPQQPRAQGKSGDAFVELFAVVIIVNLTQLEFSGKGEPL